MKYMGVESNLMRAMFPEQAGWNTNSMLLAELVDTVHWLQWVKTKDGQRNRNHAAAGAPSWDGKESHGRG